MATKKDDRDPLRTPFPNIPQEMDPTPDGVPTWDPAPEGTPPCPNCGAKVCMIKVRVKQPLLRGGGGIATYFGCPACPWASPTVVVAG